MFAEGQGYISADRNRIALNPFAAICHLKPTNKSVKFENRFDIGQENILFSRRV